MKKCPKALKNRVARYTENIFNECLIEVYTINKDDKDDIDNVAFEFRILSSEYAKSGLFGSFELTKDFEEKREKVESLYQEKIRGLTTKQLNEIIKAHHLEDGIKRAQKTIETITSELARRAILDDSGESESIDDDGDVHEPTRQSPKRRKKANGSRRKATKD